MQKDNQITEAGTKDISEQTALSFISDNRMYYLFKRVTKISRALCLVTGHIDENIEIKEKIRKDALQLSDVILGLSYKNTASLQSAKAEIFAMVMSLTSMMETLHALRLISEPNSNILNGQLKIFLGEVEQFFAMTDTAGREAPLLTFNFEETSTNTLFGTAGITTSVSATNSERVDQPVSVPGLAQPLAQRLNKQKGMSPENRVVRSSFHPTNTEFRQKLSTSKSVDQLHGLPNPDGKSASSSVKSEHRNDRQELIISTIVTKGDLSIKDLSTVIKGCSEKTIQRELISLVDKGVLHKIGERRWSRYSLAQ